MTEEGHREAAPHGMEEIPIADQRYHALDPQWISLQRLTGWITTVSVSLALLIAVVVLLVLHIDTVWIGIAGAAALLFISGLIWLAVRWPVIRYEHTSYRISDDGIEIKRGVIWQSVINVPRTRIQHTDVSQGPLERSHGLGTLVMHTGGTSNAEVSLGGLDYARALRIRDHLLPKDGRDAV